LCDTTNTVFLLRVWNKVRLGYPRAPRKVGADVFDNKRGIGRDRMLKERVQHDSSPERINGACTVVFKNVDVVGASLYFEDQLMGVVPVGGDLRFNSFKVMFPISMFIFHFIKFHFLHVFVGSSLDNN
jgi:hypothetical protein